MNLHYSIIHDTIAYIEENLHEELTLGTIAKRAGFSRFHFYRMFLKEVGVSIGEYVRYRRMANAASMLLHTDESIIEIAFHNGFHSQESFARAFKAYYTIPPGKYRKLMSGLTFKKEEKTMQMSEEIKGWFLSGSHPFNYKMSVDYKVFHSGKGSGLLQSVTVTDTNEFATMMQQFKADQYLGKRLKLSGFLKTKDVDGFSSMWMRVDDKLHDVLQFDNMMDRPIKQTTDWNYYSIILDIPENSAVISFGVILSGRGSVWVDDLKFEEVVENTPTTNVEFDHELLEEPVNLSFDY